MDIIFRFIMFLLIFQFPVKWKLKCCMFQMYRCTDPIVHLDLDLDHLDLVWFKN